MSVDTPGVTCVGIDEGAIRELRLARSLVRVFEFIRGI
jgi:hypothetical protein